MPAKTMLPAKPVSPAETAERAPARQPAVRLTGFPMPISPFRAAFFVLICVSPILIGWRLVQRISALALGNDTYTHIPLIPLVSACLIYANRKVIFSRSSEVWKLGGALLAAGVLAIAVAQSNVVHLQDANQLSLAMLGVVLVWTGAFGLFFGRTAFSAAIFPLLFLLFMVPIPEPFLFKIIHALQVGSAQATAALFGLFGIPYLQQGLVFSLPGVAIRVAEECSGIRSTLALLIMTVLASHMFLKATWKRVVVCLLAVPLSVAKNGLRIATLSALAIYVDPSFLHGRLHQYGGMFFFAAAFVPLAVIFVLLGKGEIRKPASHRLANPAGLT
jgi:exosortase